jgi:hypothetical protein
MAWRTEMSDHELPEHLQEHAKAEAESYRRSQVSKKIGVRRGAIPPHIGLLLEFDTDDNERPVSYSWAKDPRWPRGREPYPHEIEILTLQALERIERLLLRLVQD